MSTEEMRNFCLSISPYGLRVQVRLKDGSEIYFGKVANVDQDKFQLVADDASVRSLRYAWVARIRNA